MDCEDVNTKIIEKYSDTESTKILARFNERALNTRLNYDQVIVKEAPDLIDMEPEDYECEDLGVWPENVDPPEGIEAEQRPIDPEKIEEEYGSRAKYVD